MCGGVGNLDIAAQSHEPSVRDSATKTPGSVLESRGGSFLPSAEAAAGGAAEGVYMATFMVGQKLQVLALFGPTSGTLLLGNAVGVTSDFAIEDLFEEQYYFTRLHESHRAKLQEQHITTITLPAASTSLFPMTSPFMRSSPVNKRAGIAYRHPRAAAAAGHSRK
jgi:hypothetical protein